MYTLLIIHLIAFILFYLINRLGVWLNNEDWTMEYRLVCLGIGIIPVVNMFGIIISFSILIELLSKNHKQFLNKKVKW